MVAVESLGDKLVAGKHNASEEIATMVTALRADQGALKAAVETTQKRVRMRGRLGANAGRWEGGRVGGRECRGQACVGTRLLTPVCSRLSRTAVGYAARGRS